MSTVGEEGSNALDAASDLVELLRLAHEAAHRINQTVHSDTFEYAQGVSLDIHNLRQKADRLRREIEQYVKRIESQEHASGDRFSVRPTPHL